MDTNEFKFNRVMVIDDTKVDLVVASRMLKKNQFAEEIMEFDLATRAIRYLEENRHNAHLLPEAIFLDISMPEMSGFQFLDQLYFLRLCVKQISVIMLTSSLNADDYQRALNHALVKKFVNKPLDSAIIEDIKAMFFNVYFNNDEPPLTQQNVVN